MRIYVGNFAFEMSEQELRGAFEDFGRVQELSMIRDRDTGRPKGFAFVEMASDAEAQAAIAGLNGAEIGGRALTVNEARPRPERSASGGGAGGYRNSRGGGGDRW
jgi:RNA recognition motif-containing protein